MTGGPLTLGELIGPRGLKLLNGDPSILEETVRGIHSTDYPHPADLIEPHWVVLTNGAALRGHPDLQRALVRDLHETGALALGFGTGMPFKTVPKAVVSEARELGFPVFEVPFEVSFIEMTRDVYMSVSDDGTRVFLRLTALQRNLVEALSEPDPQRTMLDRLATLLRTKVAIVRADGVPLISAGRIPAINLEEALVGQSPRVLESTSRKKSLFAVPIGRAQEKADRWLVALMQEDSSEAWFAKRATQMAAPLFAAVGTLEGAAKREDRQLRADLLSGMVGDLDPQVAANLAPRAEAFGITFSPPSHVAKISSLNRDGLPFPLESLFEHVEGQVLPCLACTEDDGAVVLLQGTEEEVLAEVEALLDKLGPGFVAGVGRPAGSLIEVPVSARDASMASRQARDTDERVLCYADFELDLVLLAEVPEERVAPLVAETVDVLTSNPPLHRTILAYFRNDLNIALTADELFIHPNSLRYRLRRLEDLTGLSLKTPRGLAILHLTLCIADRGFEDPPEGEP